MGIGQGLFMTERVGTRRLVRLMMRSRDSEVVFSCETTDQLAHCDLPKAQTAHIPADYYASCTL